jgi:hypothetical protein
MEKNCGSMWSNDASDHSDKFVYAKFIGMQITLLGNPFQKQYLCHHAKQL